MKTSELSNLGRKELLKIARGQKVKNAAKYRKADLIEQIVQSGQFKESYQAKKSKKLQSLKEESAQKSEVAVAEAPPYLSPQEYPEPKAESAFTLPYSYNVTKVVLMIRDPHWAYAYWDIDEGKYKEVSHLLQMHSGRMKTILRTYDVTDIDFNGNNSHRIFDTDVNLDAKGWYLNLGASNRDYCVDLGLLDDRGSFHLIARSNIMRTPRDTASDTIDENWMVRDFDEIYSLSGGLGVGLSSGELRRKKRLLFEQNISSGAVASSPGFFMKQPKEKDKDFFLEVDTELILYGKTKPDAAVTIGGKQVPLRPDGTFSIRFHLPDGTRLLPVEAASSDKDDRQKISVKVQKNTH